MSSSDNEPSTINSQSDDSDEDSANDSDIDAITSDSEEHSLSDVASSVDVSQHTSEGDASEEEDKESEEQEISVAKQSKNTPQDIKFKSQVTDIAMNPTRSLLAAGEVNGKISLHSYSVEDGNKKLLQYHDCKKACRALSFFNQGKSLLSAFKNKSIRITDIETGTGVKNIKGAHNSPLYSMKSLSESLFATGDEEGCVKVWDSRTCSAVMEWEENEDFISDIAYVPEKKTLLCTSGDGTLSVFNIGKKKLEHRSDQLDEELLSVGPIKSNSKILCGGGDGTLHIYSWGRWADVSDRFPGHPSSIDTLCPIGDDVICTGCADGKIRVVRIQPNSFVSVVGDHDDFPVERIRLSFDSKLIASCSHDNRIKFWDIGSLATSSSAGDEDVDAGAANGPAKSNRKRKLQETKEQGASFFSDL